MKKSLARSHIPGFDTCQDHPNNAEPDTIILYSTSSIACSGGRYASGLFTIDSSPAIYGAVF